jgi:hypothetical protein
MAFETNFAQHPTPQKFPPSGDTLSHTFFPESALFVTLIYNKKKNSHTPSFLSSTLDTLLLRIRKIKISIGKDKEDKDKDNEDKDKEDKKIKIRKIRR